MKTAGIISEYNPFHSGHAGHISKTRQVLGDDAAVVCVMSGNYVQRGDFAIFNKHARAKMAVLGGADLILELPTPYVLMSAEGFAKAGVYILESLGVCDYLSFGSECDDIDLLTEAAKSVMTDEADNITRQYLGTGVSYATAQQFAADTLLGKKAKVFKSPNNVLGTEYIKALIKYESNIQPVTFKRTGGDHNSDIGYCGSGVRKILLADDFPITLLPGSSLEICKEEKSSGRGPVSNTHVEQAILSRLRTVTDFSNIQGISEGLEQRFGSCAHTETSIESILIKTKTKRFPMSRIRRVLLCAALNITKEYMLINPPYIKILAMNNKGASILKNARKKSKLPIITKPAAVNNLCETSRKLFNLESSATDLYVLAYKNEACRKGRQEWITSPIII